VRANVPAHIALDILFVGHDAWIRFRALRKLWRRALRDDLSEAADTLAQEMLARFERWAGESA
jgi:hypothetical protein